MKLRGFFLRFHRLIEVRVEYSYLIILRLKYAGRVYLGYDSIGPSYSHTTLSYSSK